MIISNELKVKDLHQLQVDLYHTDISKKDFMKLNPDKFNTSLACIDSIMSFHEVKASYDKMIDMVNILFSMEDIKCNIVKKQHDLPAEFKVESIVSQGEELFRANLTFKFKQTDTFDMIHIYDIDKDGVRRNVYANLIHTEYHAKDNKDLTIKLTIYDNKMVID